MDDLFPCSRLTCRKVLARVCIARQEACDAATPGTRDTWRGQAPKYVNCASWRCAEGRRIRARLATGPLPDVVLRARSAGMVDPRRDTEPGIHAALRRLEAERPPTIDSVDCGDHLVVVPDPIRTDRRQRRAVVVNRIACRV